MLSLIKCRYFLLHLRQKDMFNAACYIVPSFFVLLYLQLIVIFSHTAYHNYYIYCKYFKIETFLLLIFNFVIAHKILLHIQAIKLLTLFINLS